MAIKLRDALVDATKRRIPSILGILLLPKMAAELPNTARDVLQATDTASAAPRPLPNAAKASNGAGVAATVGPEPSNVMWENLEITDDERKVITFLVTM